MKKHLNMLAVLAVLVLGTGGNCLGIRGVLELLQGPDRNLKNLSVIFAGNSLSTRQWKQVRENLEGKRFSVLILSGPGEGRESLLMLRDLKWILDRKCGTDESSRRIIAAASGEDERLNRMAQAYGWDCFAIPSGCGGSFGVLSAAGLLVMEAAGLDASAVWQGAHNKESSIRSFAKACFQYAIDTKQDLWFSTKDTIAKIYDGEFKKVFEEEFEAYKAKFEELGITYFYTLIDDAVARVIRSEGGFIWACKNYDGDVMSDMVSTAYGSLAMMTSVLVSPDGIYEYEAAHGTVQRHYYKYLKGEETSTNSVATIFAWSGALRKRGELDNISALCDFADKLEKATIQTIEEGIMTGDLYPLSKLENKQKVGTEEFLLAVNETLKTLI